MLFAAATDGTLYTFDRFTLTQREHTRLLLANAEGKPEPAVLANSVAADDQHVYVTASHHQLLGRGAATLFALHRNTLAVVWTVATDALQISPPVLHDGMVYFTARNGRAWAVEAASGKVLSWAPPIENWSDAAPAVTDNLVILPACSSHVVARGRRDSRRVRWIYAAPEGQPWFNRAPCLYEERVCLADNSGALHILDLATGQLIAPPYRSDSPKPFLTQPLVALCGVEPLILVGGKDHCLHAVDMSGKRRWVVDCGASIYSRPLVLDNEVYVANHAGVLYALALEDGRLLGTAQTLGESVEASLASDGVNVIVAGRSATLWQVAPSRRALEDPAAHLARHEYALAAQAQALAGSYVDAAALCLDPLKQFAAAAQLLRAAGEDRAALDAYVEAGDIAAAEALLAYKGLHYSDPARAAALLTAARQFSRAAEVWLEAERAQEAISCWLLDGSASALQAALALSREREEWRSEVKVLAALGRNQDAGDLALRQARSHEDATQGQDADELFERYAQALARFSEAGTPRAQEWIAHCRDKVRYYGQLPNLRVELVSKDETHRLQQVHPLNVRVTNVGRSPAYNIHVQLQAALGALQGQLEDTLDRLGCDDGNEWLPNLDIAPTREGTIRLACVVTYTDRRGSSLDDHHLWWLRVHGRPGYAGQTIIVQPGGQFVQSGGDVTIVGGDYIRDGGQKGDRVTIQRTLSHPNTCSRCHTPLAAGAAYCDTCGQKVDDQTGKAL